MQADLNLCWAYMPEGTFSDVAVQLTFVDCVSLILPPVPLLIKENLIIQNLHVIALEKRVYKVNIILISS